MLWRQSFVRLQGTTTCSFEHFKRLGFDGSLHERANLLKDFDAVDNSRLGQFLRKLASDASLNHLWQNNCDIPFHEMQFWWSMN